jgi:prepilin-type N-terminal cleavage/methylation domain-containing protein
VITFRTNIQYAGTDRRAVTLIEVLMSLMIMSIGVSAVMVLFPISVLRSVQSTQMTNAAILKYNTEAQLRRDPKVIFDPDGNYDLATNEQQRQLAVSEHYQSAAFRNYIVDPVGFHGFFGFDNDGNGTVDAADDAWARSFGNDGYQPGFQLGTPPSIVVPSLRRYDGRVITQFGGVIESGVLSSALSADQITALQQLSSRLARLGDGRTVQLDTFAEGAALVRTIAGTPYLVGVQLPSSVAVDELVAIPTSTNSNPGGLIPDPELAEIVLFSVDGKFSQTYPLTHISPADRKAFWSEYDDDATASAPVDFNRNGYADVRPLPAQFGGSIGRVLLRSVRTADYSWLLTVRRGSDGQARGVDVVIRYHSGVKPQDERVFPATFTKEFNLVGLSRPLDGTEPLLKRGNFIFDPANARWYRITDYEERPAAGFIPAAEVPFWTAYDYRVRIETTAVADAGVLPTSSTAAVYSGAMLLPGVVEVYPMGSLSLPSAF